MLGTIILGEVEAGDEVKAGDVLLTLEGMEMEKGTVEPGGGVVKEVKVSENQSKADEVLIALE